MNKYATELIGTFFLVLTIGLMGRGGMAPLAIGCSLMVMVYMGGHVSGAHYNPAVTLAIWMRGKLEAREVVPYMVAQLAGAFFAAVAAYIIMEHTFAPKPAEAATTTAALLTEVLYTFALALVVLNVATDDATAGNSYYGLAIGFTIFVGAAAGGPVSGGAFNPAVGTGPILWSAIKSQESLGQLWLYLVGPFAGGAAAALAYRLQHPES